MIVIAMIVVSVIYLATCSIIGHRYIKRLTTTEQADWDNTVLGGYHEQLYYTRVRD